MNQNWQQFLREQHAHITNGVVEHFGDAEAEINLTQNTGNIVCDLSHYGLIAVTGDDAQSFMQGQFSNDVTQVSPQHSQLNSYNNPKGRCLACFRLLMHEDRYLLRLPAEILAPTLQRLRMFVLRSAVILDDASDQVCRMGLAGTAAEALLAQRGLAPEGVDHCSHDEKLTVVRVPSARHPRFEVYGDAETLQALWREAAAMLTPVGEGGWRLLEIEAGLPEVFSTTREVFVPQMLNLDKLNGISFTKGCYTGQEIVARMHYLGKLKRRMYLAEVTSPQAPQAGDKLYAGGEQSVGEVVNSQHLGNDHHRLLAVIQIQAIGETPIHLGTNGGPLLRRQALPYSLGESE